MNEDVIVGLLNRFVISQEAIVKEFAQNRQEHVALLERLVRTHEVRTEQDTFWHDMKLPYIVPSELREQQFLGELERIRGDIEYYKKRAAERAGEEKK